jgi:hypothetical protein
MEALTHNRDMEMGSEWQLFGGQLQDLSVQSTFADLQGHVLQNSWHDDTAGELFYQRSDVDFLEDSTWQYPVDVINSKQPSSLKVKEGPSVYEEDLYDLLSSSPEEAFLPGDDDNTVSDDITSTEDNSFNVVVPSFGSGSGFAKSQFDYKNIQSGQQYLTSDVLQNLFENQKIHVEVSHDLIEADEAIRTDSFAADHGLYLDSLYYENQDKSAAELDGIECPYDSLLDPDNVCKLLSQLVDNQSDPYSCRPLLLSVSPEEVDSVLSNASSPRSFEDYDSMRVPCSPPVSDAGFVSFSEVNLSSAAVLATEYRQDSLSSTLSTSLNQSSMTSVPYRVEPRSDRKLKKKEQNKTAALRYRNKKREEKGVVYSEVEELEQKNAKLQAKADDLTREISYLKGLLDEIKRQ